MSDLDPGKNVATCSVAPYSDQKGSPRQNANMSPVQRDASDVYVGLVNQAMTCYLNSLLQTLFMTPEFRDALYNWEYTGTNEEQGRSIPYQLQKLFVLLQTSVGVKTSLETKDLTKSFGWDSSHAWDQHDVQELCRVMFDALEVKWRRTDQATVITTLYQGTMKDYVKCLQCSTENARNDVFLDLPLAIKPFGSTQAYRSVEDALRGFVQPEQLDGTNQYSCDKCQKKVNAHKGLKVTKFPYLLTIQLKRFDFDYTTMHRIKLNDRMTFPDLLNLNPFVEPDRSQSEAPIDETLAPDCQQNASEDSSMSGLVEGLDENAPGERQLPRNDDGTEPMMAVSGDSDDEGICVDGTIGAANSGADSPVDAVEEGGSTSYHYDSSLVNSSIDASLLDHYLKEGPFVYELFSVMVHSGSANGGHYYAYIKNLDSKVWYCFNDQVVTRASIEDIRKTYGGASSSPFMYSSYGSSTNAYMLMYRQINPERNAKFPSSTKLPEHIMRMIDKLHLEEEEQRLAEERQRALMAVRVHFYNPSDGRLFEKQFEVQKTDMVSSLVGTAHRAFGLDAAPFEIPLELCRLVRFSKQRELFESSLDSYVTIHQALAWTYGPPDLLLETAPWPGWFCPYYSHGITLKVFVVDLESGRVRLPKALLYATKDTTVMQLKERIGQLLNYDPSCITLVLDHYSRSLRLLDVPKKTLGDEDIWCQGMIFVQCGSMEAADGSELETPMTPKAFEKTRLYTILDQFKNTIRVKVALPSINDYDAVGFDSPFKMNPSDVVVDDAVGEEIDDKAGFQFMPMSCSLSIVPANTVAGIGESKPLLTVHQQEECSTASGSTQYVTPATSRHTSPDRCGIAMSPVSQGDRSNSGPTTPEVEANTSLCATPSPQVSPDASPVSGSGSYGQTCDDQFEYTIIPTVSKTYQPDPSGAVRMVHASREEFNRLVGVVKVEDRVLESSCDHGVRQGNWCEACGKDSLDRHGLELAQYPPLPVSQELCPCPMDGPPTPPSERIDYYYNVVNVKTAITTDKAPVLAIDVDKRMSLAGFIQKLAPHVGVTPDQFKLYKVYPAGEYECTTSSSCTLETLSSTNELRVKLGRPLKEGEQVVKFMSLDLNDLEACGKHLFDIIIRKEDMIEDIKRECRAQLNRHCGLDVPVERIRLRDGGTGFMDVLRDGTPLDDRHSYWSCDVYLQVLEQPETVTTPQHAAVFVRRWCPGSLSLGPIQEVVVGPPSPGSITEQYPEDRQMEAELFMQISHVSNIPVERVQCSANASEGSFPYECGKLKLLEGTSFCGLPVLPQQCHQDSLVSSTGCCEMDSEGDGGNTAEKDQEWTSSPPIAVPAATSNTPTRFSSGFGSFNSTLRDGMLIYYRDTGDQPRTLSDDERKELQIRDHARLRRNQAVYSWRKERALKIYTEISSSLADELD